MSGAPPGSDLPRVFLDSNVIFSGLYSPDGPPGSILRYMIERRIVAVVSSQILDEIVGTFKKKLPQALPALNKFLVNSSLEVVGDPSESELSCWTDVLSVGDASILAAAIAANPDYFVTGDNHFPGGPVAKRNSDLAICSPAGLLEILGLD